MEIIYLGDVRLARKPTYDEYLQNLGKVDPLWDYIKQAEIDLQRPNK